jgi:growth differentiation factor 8/11
VLMAPLLLGFLLLALELWPRGEAAKGPAAVAAAAGATGSI